MYSLLSLFYKYESIDDFISRKEWLILCAMKILDSNSLYMYTYLANEADTGCDIKADISHFPFHIGLKSDVAKTLSKPFTCDLAVI